MDIQKFLLLLVFCFSGYLLVDAWQKEHQAPAQLNIATDIPQQETRRLRERTVTVEDGASAQSPRAQSPRAQPRAEKITVTTDYLVAELSSLGGDIKHLEFIKHHTKDDKTKNFVLLQESENHTYVVQSGLLGKGLPNHKTTFLAEGRDYRLNEGENEVSVHFQAQIKGPYRVTKTYTFRRSSYLIQVSYKVTNEGGDELTVDPYYQIVRDASAPAGESFLMPTYTGMAFYSDSKKFNKVSFSKIDKNKAPSQTSEDGWVAVVQHYFVSAWLLPEKTQGEFYFKKQPNDLYATGIITSMGRLRPGETGASSAELYAGPQEKERLDQAARGLEFVVDFGWLTVLAKPLLWVLKQIHGVVGNWGVAIILLTVLVKILFYPLSAAGYRSMARMKLLTPKLQKLKEQYGGEKQKLHQAMVGLYREEKVNPLGGCLPILVQIPVFIALYWALLAAIELRHAPFFLWIQDLSVQDPYFILPVLMGASMFVQTRLNPVPPDPIQAKIMKIMPIAFSIFFFFFPAGLVLYWLVNNILSIAQQWRINRVIERAKLAHGKR